MTRAMGPRTPAAIAPENAPNVTAADLDLRALRRSLLLDDAHGLDHVDGPLDLDVLLQVLERVERRLPRRSLLRLLGQLDHDVRRDALAVDRAAVRREVFRGRQPEPRAVREGDDRLHRTLAERLRAEDDRALPVLERPGDDLRRRRAPLVEA